MYDANGNRIQTTVAGIVTTDAYDADNEPTSKTTNTTPTTTISAQYDADGNVISQVDGLTRATTYAYDPLNRVSSVTDPLNRTRSYGYDANGNQTTFKDPMGRTTTSTYDAANQLCAVDYTTTPAACGSGTHDVTVGYNALGQRVSMKDSSGSGTSTYQYDSLDRITQNTDAAGNTVKYGYDLAGNLTSLTYPDNSVVTRSYDAGNQLTAVSDWSSPATATRYAYDANSNLITEALPSGTGLATSFTYNQLDSPTGETVGPAAGGNPLWNWGYGRTDATQRLATLTDSMDASQHSFAYDALSRLTQDTQTAGGSTTNTLTWGYDAGDNLTSIGNAATSTSSTLTYDVAHELTGLTTTANGTQTKNVTYSYNANGDRTGQMDAVTSSSATFGYDQADRLTSYSAGATSASYSYNGDGLRVGKTVNGTTTSFVWDLAEGMPILLQETTGGTTTKYLTGVGGLPVEQQAGMGAPQYYIQDQQGSTRALVDGGGTTLSTFTYDPYGNLTSSSGTASTPFRYAGQYTDSESGLQYLRARYYDPQTCQFLTIDPLVGITGEPYSYTAGNPLNMSDPSGLFDWGDVGNFVQQHAGTIAAVGYVAVAGAVVTCAVFTLGICAVAGAVAVSADVATGGVLIGGGTLAASAFMPPGEGVVPGDSACPVAQSADLPGLPADWSARQADNGKGWVYQAPGPHLNQNSNSYRVMEPTDKYPNGYVRFYNKHGQPIRADGKPGSQSETHFPVDWSGPWPKGPWNEH